MSTSVASVVSHFPDAENGFSTTTSGSVPSGATTVGLNSVAGYTNGEPAVFVIDPTLSTKQTFTGIVDTSGSQITSVVWTAGTNVAHSTGATVVDYATATHIAMMSKGIKVSHNQDGTIKTTANIVPSGSIMPYISRTAPTDWLLCYGQAVSRTTYSTLLGLLIPTLGTFTITIAAPAVVTLSSHGLVTGDAVVLSTTGALPTGLTANTVQYFIVKIDANSFNLSTSYANAVAGTKITTTGTQSGVHTAKAAPHGVGNGSTTFNIPDLRGRVLAGWDIMGGTSANRLTDTSEGVDGDVFGRASGIESHTLTTAELAVHTHIQDSHNHTQNAHDHAETVATGAGSATGITGTAGLPTGQVAIPQRAEATTATNTATTATNQNAGSGNAHNITQPTIVVNYIIKT